MQQHILETIDPKLLGSRLQDARKARDLTQQQVADSLAIARTTVTALEKGDRVTRPEELIQMARLYGRSINEFVGRREPMADFAVQFRTAVASASETKGQGGLEHATQEFERLCDDYLYLEKLTRVAVGRNYPPQYQIGGVAPEAAAEDVATVERNRLGLGDGPILNLREILENDVGIRVFYTPLPSRVAGMFAYSVELGGCMAINLHHPEERRRWSMAHEYGHFLTSRYRLEITQLGGYERVPPTERFADAFARSFLMPAPGLRRRFNDTKRTSGGKVTTADICRLANFYFVSMEAIMLRLEELRLLPKGTWERLRDRGFKVREAQERLGLGPPPHDDRRLPIRYQLLAVQAYEEEKLTEGVLARLLREDRVTARRIAFELTQSSFLLDEGDLASFSVELASTIGGS